MPPTSLAPFHICDAGAGQGGQQRQVTAGRITPTEHPPGVEPVRGAVIPDPADRGAHVVERRREAGLAAEPVVDRCHREARLAPGVVSHVSWVVPDVEQESARFARLGSTRSSGGLKEPFDFGGNDVGRKRRC